MTTTVNSMIGYNRDVSDLAQSSFIKGRTRHLGGKETHSSGVYAGIGIALASPAIAVAVAITITITIGVVTINSINSGIPGTFAYSRAIAKPIAMPIALTRVTFFSLTRVPL